MQVRDLVDDSLMVRQGKTRKRIRIMLSDETGARTELGLFIDRIKRLLAPTADRHGTSHLNYGRPSASAPWR